MNCFLLLSRKVFSSPQFHNFTVMKALNKKGTSAQSIVGVLVALLVTIIMIPIIADAIADATQLTSTQATILGLIPTFLVLGVLFFAINKSGIGA